MQLAHTDTGYDRDIRHRVRTRASLYSTPRALEHQFADKNLLLRAIRHTLWDHTAFLRFHVLPDQLTAVLAETITV